VTAADLGREFFEALDLRDPHRLRATLADDATFRALPHREPIGPADEIVDYFGSVVSSYPNGHWEIIGTIGEADAAAIVFVIREFDESGAVIATSDQIALVESLNDRIIAITGYYDTAEFRRQFLGED
jgi:ketosteroid isomerase-like protein